MLRIEQVLIYPVKSLAGIALDTAVATPQGLSGDREWMIVDKQGRFVSQRQYPKLATIKTKLANRQLILSCTTAAEIIIDYPHQDDVEVSVWRDPCYAFSTSQKVGQWLSEACQTKDELRLVYFNKSQPRILNQERFGVHSTHFADAAPYLIANRSSLENLNQALVANNEPTVDIHRFRPNIVLSGLPAFAEHQVKQVQAKDNDCTFSFIDHCQRCAVITIDQHSGQKHKGTSPFKTLASINAMPNNPKAPAFGVNATKISKACIAVSLGQQFVINH